MTSTDHHEDWLEPVELDGSWFHAFMAHSPMTAFVKSAEGRLLYINPAFEAAFGFAERDWYGKSDHELWGPETARALRANDLQILASGVAEAIEETVESGNGEQRWLTVKFPFEDREGRRYLAGIGVDLTEQHKMREAVVQANRIESIGRLAGGIAHDFNNLLTVILGNCELIELGIGDEELAQSLVEIKAAAERASDLTRRLLGYARRQTIAPRTLLLTDALQGMLPLIRRLLPENIVFEVALGQPAKVHVDPTQIEQIVINLVVNARDAMPDGGRITLSSGVSTTIKAGQSAARRAWFRIADDGTGIPDEIVDKIFEPFYTTKAPGEGTGLGLATCLGIIEQNDGQLELDTKVGVGTTFTVTLPEATGPLSSAPEASPTPRRASGELVLVVEDDPSLRRILATSLRENGYVVITAEDADQALERVHGGVDLLITDMVMPGLNGVELRRTIRQRHPNILTLFISGYAMGALTAPNAPKDCMLLQKPFVPTTLLEAVWKVLHPSDED